jgi:Fe-S-cluster containining protein
MLLKKKNMKNKCENCGECCLRTEMILSKNDINRIMKNSTKYLQKEDFVFKNKDGFFQLKNISEYCVFFDILSKQCKIYEYRPQGCRFYPLIFDFEEQDCILDIDCPRPHIFYQDKNNLKKTCKDLLRFLKQELGLNLN